MLMLDGQIPDDARLVDTVIDVASECGSE